MLKPVFESIRREVGAESKSAPVYVSAIGSPSIEHLADELLLKVCGDRMRLPSQGIASHGSFTYKRPTQGQSRKMQRKY